MLLALDGLHFVMSRIALLDIFLAFWLLCAVHCLVADRDWAGPSWPAASRRRRSGRWPVRSGTRLPAPPVAHHRGRLLRPRVRARSGAPIFVLAGFRLLIWAWDSGMRRAVGVRWAPLKSLRRRRDPVVLHHRPGRPRRLRRQLDGLPDARPEVRGRRSRHGRRQGDRSGARSTTIRRNGVEGVLHDLHILWNYHREVYAFHTGEYIKERRTRSSPTRAAGW